MQLIAGGRLFYSLYLRAFVFVAAQLPGERNERTGLRARHHRHVAGSVARKKAKGRRATTRGSTLVLCRSIGGGKMIR